MSASPQANATAHRPRKPCSARAVVHAVRRVRSAGSISTAKGLVIRPLDPAVSVVRVTYRRRVELQDAPKIVVSSLATKSAIRSVTGTPFASSLIEQSGRGQWLRWGVWERKPWPNSGPSPE